MSVMLEQPVRRRRRSFTKEFKADAVALVLDEGRTVIDVATSLGIGERAWVTGFVGLASGWRRYWLSMSCAPACPRQRIRRVNRWGQGK
jgi:hypothetical protein